MATRQYIGARYVPTFANPIQWNSNVAYEALTIVTHMGNSYTSRKPVPAGTPITDSDYWANTGIFNAQVEHLIDEIDDINTQIGNMSRDIDDISHALSGENLGGKKILVFGDSLSDTNISLSWAHPNWVSQLISDLPSDATVINNSLSGRRLSGTNGVADLLTSDTNIASADILIIFAGLNDWQYGVELGTAASQTISTFCGALYTIAAHLISVNPDCLVYFVSPLRTYRTVEELPPQNDAMRPLNLYRFVLYAFCKRYGWNYVDGFSAPRLDSLSSNIREVFIPDGMHITTDYATILMRYIKSHLTNLLTDKPTNVNMQINLSSLINTDRWSSDYCFIEIDNNLDATLQFSLRGNIAPNATGFTLPSFFYPASSVQASLNVQNASDNARAIGSLAINASNGNVSLFAGSNYTDAYLFGNVKFKLALASFISLGTI